MAVTTQEQARTRPLLQAEDAHAGARELFGRGLEQLVARQCFQDMAQRLAAVAVVAQARGLHHGGVAQAHQRDVPGTAVVGAGGVQAEEALLGDGAPIGVKRQHADVVHVAGAVHGGSGIGLGQDQRIERGAGRQVGSRQPGQRARLRLLVLAAQQAHAAAVDRAQHALAVALGHFVFAIAQEGEMVVGRPVQELLRLGTPAAARRKPRQRQR